VENIERLFYCYPEQG